MKKFNYKGKTMSFWVPRILIIIYMVLAAIWAIIDSASKGLNVSGVGMLAIFAIFVGGLIYIAWTTPKTGGGIITLFGIFSIIIATSYHKEVNWFNFYSQGLPLTFIGLLFLYEGFKKK